MKFSSFVTICITVYVLFFSRYVEAATLRMDIEKEVPGTISVTVVSGPEGKRINGFEGTLLFQSENLMLERVDTVDSVVGMWVERPQERVNGQINWSGFVPGGFDGVRSPFVDTQAPGIVFRAIFRVLEDGPAGFSFANAALYEHTGTGEYIVPELMPASVVLETSEEQPLVAIPSPEDRLAGFEAYIFKDALVADGKWITIFSIDTNRVSIDRYEIAEYPSSDISRIPSNAWRAAENPYVLRRQSRSVYVHIRAIASDGTVYTKTFPPNTEDQYSTHKIIVAWGILGIFALSIYLRARRKHS